MAPSSQAIQLADEVRLPAALMPPGTNPPPPAVAAATAQITDTFYQELQAGVSRPQAGQEAPRTTDDTAIIPENFATRLARQRADEQFRALYGDEKYIQQTLNSAIEVLLPP